MEPVENKSHFTPWKIVVAILVILVLTGGGFYLYKSFFSTTTTTTKTTYKIAGSGSAAFALKLWVEQYEKQHPDIKLEFLPSADAAIAFRGVAEKAIDIGISSRKAKSEEENPVLVVTPFVKDAVVLVVNKSATGITNLTKDQIIGIWVGKITNWREIGGIDAKIVLIDREEIESSKKKLRELYIGEAKVTPDAIEVHSEAEVLKAVDSTQYSIGMLSLGRAKTSSNLLPLKIDGAGIGDVDSGAYKFVRAYYIVTRKDSPQGVNDFMTSLNSSKAQRFYSESGFYKL